MKKFGIILFGLGMLLAQPVAGQQTSPTYAPTLADQSLFKYEFKNGSYVGADWFQYVSVGPYSGLVGYSGVDRPMFTLYCVDFANRIYTGADINAWVSNVGVGNMSQTLLGSLGPASSVYGSPLLRYQKAAWLASQYFAEAGTAHWSAIQTAIWTMMTPTFGVDATYSNPWLGLVLASDWNPGAFDFNRWSVLTPMNADGTQIIGRQEMLAQTGVVTPEPQTYILLGSGLIFLVFFGRRRLREMGYA